MRSRVLLLALLSTMLLLKPSLAQLDNDYFDTDDICEEKGLMVCADPALEKFCQVCLLLIAAIFKVTKQELCNQIRRSIKGELHPDMADSSIAVARSDK